MALTLDQLREEALSLPDNDRRNLMDSLWDSFDDDEIEEESGEAEFSSEYLAELDRRSAEVANGTAVLIPFDEAMKHISETIRRR